MDSPAVLLALVTVLWLAAAAPAAVADPDNAPGLVHTLFHDTVLQRPAEHGQSEQLSLELTGYANCSQLWLGSIRFPVTGEVTLDVEVEQGLRLYLGGQCIIDAWTAGAPRTGTVTVTAGQALPLRAEWWHDGAASYARLYWSWPGHDRELIPASALSHSPADATHAVAIAAGQETVAVGNQGPFPPVVSAPAGGEAFCSGTYRPGEGVGGADGKPVRLGRGPHLFLDDYLVAATTNLERRVVRPRRDPAIPNPIITGAGDRCFQPYLTVLRDEATRRFRMWYGMYHQAGDAITSHVGYTESTDGIHWDRPVRQLADPSPIQFGDSVLDEGPDFPDPARRFKLGWWKDGGLKLATSPDGLDWTMLVPYVVLRHNHDIVNLVRDPLRRRYVATISVYTTGPTWRGDRRVTMQSTSRDLRRWTRPWYILTPVDGEDEGETQFYAMNGHLFRGGLWIGLVKVLRDDLRAPGTPEGAFGVGYTTLAWSRDGRHWVRDREPFLEPDPDPAAWDHAHAWVDYQLPVGEEVFLYYGGYKNGHKMNRFQERQIGLLRMPRDRYVARAAGETPGTLTTPLCVLRASRLTVNAKVEGELRARVLDAAGEPLPGFDYTDCGPVRGDSLDHEVRWQGDLEEAVGRPVRLEFRLTGGELYGFSL